MCQINSQPPVYFEEKRMGFAEEIKARVTTRKLCELVGLKLDRHGNALCPFHGDTNKSLKVYADPTRGWACFGCHRGGTVIDFAMEWYGLDLKQAIIRLDAEFGLGLPIGKRRTADERKAARRRLAELEKRRQEVEDARYAAESSFWRAHSLYCLVLNTLDETRPKRGENAISDAYAKALTMLPEIREEFELALYALQSAREEASSIGRAIGETASCTS